MFWAGLWGELQKWMAFRLSYVDSYIFCPCWLCLSGREYGNKMMQYSFHSHLDPHFDNVVFIRFSFVPTFWQCGFHLVLIWSHFLMTFGLTFWQMFLSNDLSSSKQGNIYECYCEFIFCEFGGTFLVTLRYLSSRGFCCIFSLVLLVIGTSHEMLSLYFAFAA